MTLNGEEAALNEVTDYRVLPSESSGHFRSRTGLAEGRCSTTPHTHHSDIRQENFHAFNGRTPFDDHDTSSRRQM